MATYVAAGAFVAINWRIPGLLVIAAGGAMNGITIALNGGQLPASKPALQMAGIEVAKGEFINSGVLKDPVLPLLRRHLRLARALAVRECLQLR